MDYYYTDAANQPRGPVSQAELQQLFSTGAINTSTMVAAVGSDQWVPLPSVLSPSAAPAGAGAPLGAGTPLGGSGPIIPAGPTEPLAIWSLVVSFIFCCPFISSIAAIVCGHMALAKIKKQPNLQGRGLAIAGLVIGYFMLVLSIIYMLITGIAGIVAALSGH